MTLWALETAEAGELVTLCRYDEVEDYWLPGWFKMKAGGKVWAGNRVVPLNETTVAEPETAPAEEKPKDPPAEEKEKADLDKENARDTGAPPPADGKCKRCGLERKLNRHKLCYPCWVELEIMETEKKAGREWKPGDPHPDWCHCEGLGEHKNGDGTARGFN